jgi:hypothetical protein
MKRYARIKFDKREHERVMEEIHGPKRQCTQCGLHMYSHDALCSECQEQRGITRFFEALARDAAKQTAPWDHAFIDVPDDLLAISMNAYHKHMGESDREGELENDNVERIL